MHVYWLYRETNTTKYLVRKEIKFYLKQEIDILLQLIDILYVFLRYQMAVKKA